MSVLLLPLQVRAGRMVTIDQDSAADVTQSVALLVDTRPGERRSVPDYGLDGPSFDLEGLREDEIRDVIEEWEPRADITSLEVTRNADGSEEVTVWAEPILDDEDF